MHAKARIAITLISLVFFLPTAWSQSTTGITVTAADGTQATVSAENTTRLANAMVLYTPNYAFTTGTNVWGTEVSLDKTTDGVHYTVTAINSALINAVLSGNSAIPSEGYVLSGAPGTQEQLLASHFKVGDVVTMNQPIINNSSLTATAINAARGTNQLIIYTPAFGASTNTNIYGYEITVVNGIVTQAGGNNSTIPSNGYVLSGHGTSDTWLASNAIVGSQVTLNGLQVAIATNAASYVYQATQVINSTRASIQSGLQQFVNAPFERATALNPQAESQLKEAVALETTNPQQSVYLTQQAVNTANTAYSYTLPSRVAEARGTWYRPVETNLQQVQVTLDRMKKGGFNELYINTWYGGTTIYPSAVMASAGLVNQNPTFAGFDPLLAFSTEAKKRGIAVYAWIDGFMVGTAANGAPVLSVHPEWAATTRNNVGSTVPTSDASTGFYWMDIDNPQVRQFVLNLTQEMVGKYGLAGVDLDYTRFPVETSWLQSFNFSDYVRQAYQAVSGVDPYTLNATQQAAAWTAWTTWLSDQEDQFAQDEYRTMKGISSKIIVSDAPETGPELTGIGKWSQYLDVVIPQASNLGAVPTLVAQVQTQLAPGNLIYAGIYPFYHHESPLMTTTEVLSGHDQVSGTNIFAFGEASEPDVTALRQGLWRNPAISPGLHPIAATKAQLGSMADDVLAVYVPRQAMNIKAAAAFLIKVGEMEVALSRSNPNLDQIQQELAGLATSVQSGTNPIVSSRLQAQAAYLETLLTYSMAKNIQ